MSAAWFDWYVNQVGRAKVWAAYGGRFLCPCCFMPTLNERAGYAICPICFWEDDGQDSDDADIVRGGPNHDYSLSEARSNFTKHHTMYREADTESFEREMLDMAFKKQLYAAYAEAIELDDCAAFDRAVALQESRYEDDGEEDITFGSSCDRVSCEDLLLRNMGCAMTSTKVGSLIGLLDNVEQIYSVSVPKDSDRLLTDHKFFDASRIAEITQICVSRIATFSVGKPSKIIVRGVDQPTVNLDYHGWPTVEAGTYAVFLMPRHREGNWLGPVLFAYTKLAHPE